MKIIKIAFLISMCLLLTCCQTSDNNRTSSSNNQTLIGSELSSEEDKKLELNISFDFEVIDIVNYDFNGDNKNDAIKIERIIDWGDPGDFHKITLTLSGQDEVMFFNIDGWMRVTPYELQFTESLKTNSLVKSDYVVIQKASKKDILLIAYGYVYASQPGLLTIVNITREKAPALIFNDNYHLYKFTDKNEDDIEDIVVTKYGKGEQENEERELKTYLLTNGWFSLQ